ncbi:MAG: hypothetical protein HY924_12695 [Elusimicrobia bacterium]|nr:hypothetical protein [Elusimicrobiota bacterium]
MKVRVRLIGQFSERLGFAEKDLEFPSAPTAAELTARVGLKGLEHVITREGLPLACEDRLKDKDRVVIAPIFSGG